MPKLEFVGQSARDGDNIAASPSRLVNMYRETTVSGEKTAYVLKGVLGTTLFSEVAGIFMRAMAEVNGVLFVCCNGRLYEVDSSGSVADRGAADDGAQASISGNNGDVTVATGGKYFLWNGSTLTEPTAGAFSDFGSVTFLKNYTVLTQLNGRQFCWSSLADASTLPGLSFTTADGRDDDIVRALAVNDVLYVFKERSHEIWYVTGQAGASAFQRQVGGVVDVGLKAFNLVTLFDGGAFFVGDEGRAYVAGGGMRPVSTPAVETAIKDCGPEACFTYEDEGHTFCVITFADCPAWSYDVSNGEWHERAQGASIGPWEASCSARFGNTWYIGRTGGQILSLGRTSTDGGVPLARQFTSRTAYFDGSRQSMREIEIFPRVGDEAATVMMRLSRDNGRTWTEPKERSWSVGEYGKRVIWRNQGLARQVNAQFTITDVADISINAEGRVRV